MRWFKSYLNDILSHPWLFLALLLIVLGLTLPR